MTSKKSVKRTLLASVLALCLCFTMLVGTTFAWFTDSTASTGNIIKSGKLDIKMSYSATNEADSYVDVEATDAKPIFNYDKWEPGYTDMKYIKIENIGTLAFMWQLHIVPNGTVGNLAEVIDVYVAEVKDGFVLEENSFTNVGTLKDMIAEDDGAAHGALLAPKSTATPDAYERKGSVTLCIALHMREDAGNDYMNSEIGTSFDLKLLATQYTEETDSFSDQYDAVASWLGDIDTDWYTPDATVYTLNSPAELAGLASLVNDGTSFEGKTIQLNADIDANNVLWTPIGTDANPFYGTFDGNNHTIYNLKIGSSASSGNAAMFTGIGDNAVLKNVIFENVDVQGKYAAVLVGDTYGVNPDNVLIENIKVLSGSVVSTTGYGAGIISYMDGSGTVVKNCVNNANITANYVGGIGTWVCKSTISNCVNNGTLTSSGRAGGILANFSGTMTGCTNNGDIISANTYENMPSGGIVAVISASSTIEYCVNNANVTTNGANANASAAGIVGQNPSFAVSINHCVNNGDIVAKNASAGGIAVSLHGGITATNCYNSGNVSGSTGAGAIAPPIVVNGGSDNAIGCLNAGTITSNSGNVYQGAHNTTNSFYYDNGVLYAADGSTADANEALDTLNGSGDFFEIVNGIIVPKA